jgi:hypothetical protein
LRRWLGRAGHAFDFRAAERIVVLALDFKQQFMSVDLVVAWRFDPETDLAIACDIQHRDDDLAIYDYAFIGSAAQYQHD